MCSPAWRSLIKALVSGPADARNAPADNRLTRAGAGSREPNGTGPWLISSPRNQNVPGGPRGAPTLYHGKYVAHVASTLYR